MDSLKVLKLVGRTLPPTTANCKSLLRKENPRNFTLIHSSLLPTDPRNTELGRFTRMEHKCPKCSSVIYSRKNVLCGVCGERLPAKSLFTAKERAAVERGLTDTRRRARQSRALDGSSSGDAGFIGGYSGGDDGGGDGGGGD